jgi:hypothetical protein
MGGLIRNVSGESGIGYGVNKWELVPPGQIRAGGAVVVGIVGDFPWGPVNTLTEVNTVAEFNSYFCPDAFDAADTYPAMDALLNKTFPAGMLVCRIAPTSVARTTASKTFQDGAGTPANSVTVTANYPGLLGNSISITWAVNADNASARDATVTIGTGYSATYENVAVESGGAVTVTDPEDPYVTFSKYSGATTAPAAVAATALTGGADGTAQASDYVGSTSSSVGIRKYYAEAVEVDVLFVASCPSGLIDTVNTGLEAFATDTDKGMVVLCTPASQTEATAKTYVASYRDDRIVYCYPRVKTTNGFSDDQEEITVDGNSFMAALLAATDAWLSPGGPRASRNALKGITGLENEDISRSGYDQLAAKGIAAFRFLGSDVILSKGVTTSLTSGLEKIRRRRSTDYWINAISERMQEYVEQPLDLTLSSQALGPITGAQIGEIVSFLEDEKTKNHLAAYSVDPWGSATENDIDAGRWTIAIAITTYSDQDEIVLKANVGDSVEIIAE